MSSLTTVANLPKCEGRLGTWTLEVLAGARMAAKIAIAHWRMFGKGTLGAKGQSVVFLTQIAGDKPPILTNRLQPIDTCPSGESYYIVGPDV